MQTLAERFADGNGAPIKIGETTVHNIYRRTIQNGDIVNVRFGEAANAPRQGLRMKIDSGTIIVNDQELKEVVVWRETAPQAFSIECRVKKPCKSAELRIWNCWADPNGVTHAWIGNAGIIVGGAERQVFLGISPGVGDFDPSAMVVELTFV